MRIPGRVWVQIHRAQNRVRDIAAVVAGYCNDQPGEPGGGYRHWRCARRQRHRGLHRFRNYVWDAQGRTEYAPVDAFPSQPWDRNGTPTRRQARLDRDRRRADAEKRAAVRRARRDTT